MASKIETILNNYPKKRPRLNRKLKKIYKTIYSQNRSGVGLLNKISSSMESWMHRVIEKRILKKKIIKTLEIGAGNLNHLGFVKKKQIYDVVEPYDWLYKNSKNKSKINNFFNNLSKVPKKNKYDRIISIATLEHVTDLPYLLKKSKFLLKKNGIFQAAIPCEGELSWYLAWRFGTGLGFWLKHKVDYSILMKHEHVNNLNEISSLIEFYFNNIKIHRSPMPFFLKKKHTSFYAYLEAKKI